MKLAPSLNPFHWRSRLLASFSSAGRERYIILVIILLAFFTRFYNLENTLQFLGDQGRDSLIVAKIFRSLDPVFIGPVTSVGNMYLGPGYYYFMVPFLWASYPSPVGPAYAVAALSVATVFLLYQLGKQLIGPKAALVAAGLFTLSSTVITFSRFSWNPNPAPLVSLLLVYFTHKAWQKHPKYWLAASLCFSILIQLHYLSLLSAAGVGVIWLISLTQKLKIFSKNKEALREILITTLASLAIFALSLTPLMLFDAKHGWLNAKSFQAILSRGDTLKSASSISLPSKLLKIAKETHGRSMHILFEFHLGQHRKFNTALTVAFFGVMGWMLKEKKSKYWSGYVVLTAFLVTSIVGISFYEHTVFDHYIAYLFPITFLALGTVLVQIWPKALGKLAVVSFFTFFLYYNLPRLPLKTLGQTIDNLQQTTDTITKRVTPGELYNIVLLSETKDLYGQNYRYFLSTVSGKEPLPPEESAKAETLFIINEEYRTKDALDTKIYEIGTFPSHDPVEIYQVPDGPEVVVLKREY